MPFVSNAQKGWMYANKPAMAKEWQAATPKGTKLPYKVKSSTAAGIHKGLMGEGNGRGKGY